MPWSIRMAILLSVFGTVVFGTIVPATQLLTTRAWDAAERAFEATPGAGPTTTATTTTASR
jgi:hypothetical protein